MRKLKYFHINGALLFLLLFQSCHQQPRLDKLEVDNWNTNTTNILEQHCSKWQYLLIDYENIINKGIRTQLLQELLKRNDFSDTMYTYEVFDNQAGYTFVIHDDKITDGLYFSLYDSSTRNVDDKKYRRILEKKTDFSFDTICDPPTLPRFYTMLTAENSKIVFELIGYEFW